jgi:hypothetical protein
MPTERTTYPFSKVCRSRIRRGTPKDLPGQPEGEVQKQECLVNIEDGLFTIDEAQELELA